MDFLVPSKIHIFHNILFIIMSYATSFCCLRLFTSSFRLQHLIISHLKVHKLIIMLNCHHFEVFKSITIYLQFSILPRFTGKRAVSSCFDGPQTLFEAINTLLQLLYETFGSGGHKYFIQKKYLIRYEILSLQLFLAVQNSSIGDLVTD